MANMNRNEWPAKPLIYLVAILIIGCEREPNKLPETDQRIWFLSTYYPQLKTTYDQMIFESIQCWRSIAQLRGLRWSFDQKEAIQSVSAKINELEEQKASLDRQIQNILLEAEKGIANRAFAQIDGGGTRPPRLKELEIESAGKIGLIRELGALRGQDADSEVEVADPPRALPVWPPKALPAGAESKTLGVHAQ